MRARVRLIAVAVSIALIGISLFSCFEILRRTSTQTWLNLNLPATTGIFLQALNLAAIIYIFWILLGLLFGIAALSAEQAGRYRLAHSFQRYSPRFLKGLAVSLVNTGLLVAAPTISAVASTTQSSVSQEQAGQEAERFARTSRTEVPLPTWVPQHTAISLNRAVGSPVPHTKSRQLVPEVVVRPGDTLWNIAHQHLGDSASINDIAAYWPRIHALNREVIGNNPHLLSIGTVLLLPISEK